MQGLTLSSGMVGSKAPGHDPVMRGNRDHETGNAYVLPLDALLARGLTLLFEGFVLRTWRGWVWGQRLTDGQQRSD
jgi:hypothetical protein